MPNDYPIVVLDACRKHRPRDGTKIVQVGKDGTALENDRMMDVLRCGDCWRKDESGLLDLMAMFKFSPEDVVTIRNHALGKQRA